GVRAADLPVHAAAGQPGRLVAQPEARRLIRPLELLAAAFGFGLIFAGTELCHRRGVAAESTRRAAHAAGAGGAALAQLLLTLPEMVVLAAGFTAFLVGTRALGRLRSIHGVTRRTLGAQLLPVGLLLAVGAGWQHPAA